MFEHLLSIESLLTLSVGALFSFRIGRINLNLKNNIRNQSPDINGNNNLVIYNQSMINIQKEMAFSVKVCAVVMMIMFHMFPVFFLKLLLSLSFFLPLFCIIGVVNSIRLNGSSRGWDILYCMASIVMGTIFYCSVKMMVNYVSLYPQLTSLYEYLTEYRLMGVIDVPRESHAFFFVIMSSFACPALIVLGFYLTFAYTTARDGNNAFRYSAILLASGYMAYLFLSGGLFSTEQGDTYRFASILTYPFVTLFSLFPF